MSKQKSSNNDVKLTDKQVAHFRVLFTAKQVAERDMAIALAMVTPDHIAEGTTMEVDLDANLLKFGSE